MTRSPIDHCHHRSRRQHVRESAGAVVPPDFQVQISGIVLSGEQELGIAVARQISHSNRSVLQLLCGDDAGVDEQPGAVVQQQLRLFAAVVDDPCSEEVEVAVLIHISQRQPGRAEAVDARIQLLREAALTVVQVHDRPLVVVRRSAHDVVEVSIRVQISHHDIGLVEVDRGVHVVYIVGRGSSWPRTIVEPDDRARIGVDALTVREDVEVAIAVEVGQFHCSIVERREVASLRRWKREEARTVVVQEEDLRLIDPLGHARRLLHLLLRSRTTPSNRLHRRRSESHGTRMSR
jgi:hypothetical protein